MSLASMPGLNSGRLYPGLLLQGRYRIIAQVGKGGMGEVYKAEDTKVGELVALKLLPDALASDPDAIRRLIEEVRLARRVTHPSVCRVHDVGEHEGRAFLTMEYVDGENFASIFRRIGKLPQDKGLMVAHEICAGLAAAHEQFILHRDLKPANILLDGNGHAKIADFGLAGLEEELKHSRVRAGTPAYMAPEQLRGMGVTVQSDVYAVGLLLFEIFTGKPVFRPKTIDELMEMQDAPPPSPTAANPLLEPRIERVILWCLERDPAKRPPSMRAVSAALPGGGTLAAVLMAGQTPSPEQVAAAGERGRLSPAWGAALAAVFAALVVIVMSAANHALLVQRVPLERSAQTLSERARDIVDALGYDASVKHRAYGFDVYEELLGKLAERDQSASRWDMLSRVRPAAIDFWYRQSPVPMVPVNGLGRVTFVDPPFDGPGMLTIRLDPQGRLREFASMVVQIRLTDSPEDRVIPSPKVSTPVDWGVAFDAAGLDIARFRPTDPARYPSLFATERFAWLGEYPESPDERIRIEGASLEGRVVAFRVVEERWARAAMWWAVPTTPAQRLGKLLSLTVLVVSGLGAVVLAGINLFYRRGDRVGAFRLAMVMAGIAFLAHLLQADHQRNLEAEIRLFASAGIESMRAGMWFWLLYVALEPYVRRLWPESLISWSRLVAGRVRDPLVGQHVIAGGVLGAGCAILVYVETLVTGWAGFPPAQPYVSPRFGVNVLQGGLAPVGVSLDMISAAVEYGLATLMLIVLVRFISRREWIAASFFGAVQTSVWTLTTGHSPLAWGVYGVMSLLAAVALVRFGLLSLVVGVLFYGLLTAFPVVMDVSRWYAPITLFAIGAVAVLFVLATLTATGVIRHASEAPELDGLTSAP
jgi:serine/threonine-protein kinase